MKNLENFCDAEKFNEISQEQKYTKEEVEKKISQGIDLDTDFANYLLSGDEENIEIFINNLDKFKDLDKEIALKLIETGDGYLVAGILEKFQGLNHQDIALKLIETYNGKFVVNNLEKFQGLNHQEIALKLIEAGDDWYVADNLKKFQNLNQEIALKLIETRQGYYVVNNLEKFQGLNYQDIALKLFDTGSGYLVADNLEKFQGLNYQDIALKLIGAKQGYCVVNNLEKFQGLDYRDITLKLIESGDGKFVVNNLEKFQGLNHQNIALKLFITGNGYLVADNLEKFQGLNHQEIALKLIKAKQGYCVVNNLEKFQGLDHRDIALKLIKAGQGYCVVNNLEKFQGLNYQDIALKLIEAGETDKVIENIESLQLSPQNLYNAVKEKYPDLINKIETKIPELVEQLPRSVDLLLNFMLPENNFDVLEKSISENPFLLKAIKNNPRYGGKLILKFDKFDETAKTDIQELLAKEEEILKENPRIDRDSAKFRGLMQEKLSHYANNDKILKEFSERGIDTNKWLNYDKEVYFTLGETEDVKFSDQVETPIIRIRETLNKYQDSIIKVLSDYKTDLQEAFVPNQESEVIRQKITEQREKISQETDERKKQGMQKGLASLEAKEETLKPVSIWSKVQSDIFRLKSMTDNIFKSHDVCVETETKIETTTDRKELMKGKENLEKNKLQFRESFKEFEQFFDTYETKLQELIAPSLGQDRAEALLQEIKETIGEEFNHYNTDTKTLKDIFSEQNKNKSNKLDDREMKISVSSRSTNDLYLGNYCPCCICIESEYHGAHSPIADYVTDLGIQNIVVYDEKTKSPVVVCWTFIGENDKDGEPIMVVDNIEANTSYTNNYPEKLKEVISAYINDYAKSINVNTIIQGAQNNDLEVLNLGRVKRKLGNLYNRLDYFLEAKSEDIDEDED